MEDVFEEVLEQLAEQVEGLSKDDRKLFDAAVEEILTTVRDHDVTPPAAGTLALAYVSLRGVMAGECNCPDCEFSNGGSSTTH